MQCLKGTEILRAARCWRVRMIWRDFCGGQYVGQDGADEGGRWFRRRAISLRV